ncbi:MAG: hypothetical protein B7X00_01845, partial [Legionella sp. 21-45-4]
SHPVHIHVVWSNRVSPGLTDILLDKASVDGYLNQLFAGFSEASVPVYFYATAGMRLLPSEQQEQYYQFIHDWFSRHALPLIEARTISGREEGVFAWVAVALESGRLLSGEFNQIAVMDMGGASVQVVFPVLFEEFNQSAQFGSNVVSVSLYGKSIYLFSYSVLGMGKSLINNQFLNDPVCYPLGYTLSNGELTFLGDAELCQAHVSEYMNGVYHVSKDVQALVRAQPELKWYALSGLVYLIQSPLLQLEGERVSPKRLLDAAQADACQGSWSELDAHFPKVDAEFDCMNASYYYALMVNGYGISPETSIDWSFQPDHFDWTLGVVGLH